MRLHELALAALCVLAPLTSGAQPDAPVAEAPARVEVREALNQVANDPNLAAERSVNMLRWKEPEAVTDEPWWWQWANTLIRWFRGLFGWIAESGRMLMWVLGGFAATLLALYIARLVRMRRALPLPKAFVPPSHVRDLDIRPESLPADVGSAALELWQRGEQRAALALLYRGMLSRLVHAHAVPVRASSTEGECLALARPRLPESGALYAARLVETWTAAVYGARVPPAGVVEALCSEFAAAFDRKSAA